MRVDFTQNVVKASVILYNFVHIRDGFRFEYTFSYKGLQKHFQLEASSTEINL